MEQRLDFNCRFMNDSNECTKYMFVENGSAKRCQALAKGSQYGCRYYEYPLNVFFFDIGKLVVGFQCKKRHSIHVVETISGKAYCASCNKSVEGRYFPDFQKDAVFKIIKQYQNFDSFYFLSSEKKDYHIGFMELHKKLVACKLFSVDDIGKCTFLVTNNYCNGCGYCHVCKKMMGVKKVGSKSFCVKCGNEHIVRKVFDFKKDKCPHCGCSDFKHGKDMELKYFVVKKRAFNW